MGWILSGQVENHNAQSQMISLHSTVSIEKELRRFWEIEELESTTTMTDEEKKCEDIYEETHHRREDGRYVVNLPFRGRGETVCL